MAWLMSMHIVSLLVWSAGLFYVPALYSAGYSDLNGIRRRQLRIRIRFVFVAVASPAAVLTIISGGVLVYVTDASGVWLAAKLTIVALMAAFHGYCGHMLALLGHEGARKKRSTLQSMWLTGIPAVLIMSVLWLVLDKPVFPS